MCEVLPMTSRYSPKAPGGPDGVTRAEQILSPGSIAGQPRRSSGRTVVGAGMAMASKSPAMIRAVRSDKRG